MIKTNPNYLDFKLRTYTDDTLAEWLRRSTRNRLGLSRTGSSPVGVVLFLRLVLILLNYGNILVFGNHFVVKT